jgi:serine/threonine protein phosphatase PrpC
VWLKDEELPGLAMSRSFGDLVACQVGVNAIPECREVVLTPEDKVIVIASDGVWEFMSNEEVANIVYPYYL